MAIAQTSIWVSIIFTVLYIVTIYFTNRKVPNAQYYLFIFISVIIIFVGIYNYRYLGKITPYNYDTLSMLTYIVGNISFVAFVVPYVYSIVKLLRGDNAQKIPIIIVSLLLLILLWWLWMVMFTGIFIGFV
ncbi:hypothetical protein BG261_04755 [Floricoccus tropicus]|uniref:Uncharacterized protein n=1 Tax=Floricoccus tropicus TaxID=1859473 RepID=A0A1E8GLW1_9LACT|nr:hypothetical protein [Floricoccus tropicus]OFI48976.1 hypothetical protein BG261_04755 [Floricoccus tropicus]